MTWALVLSPAAPRPLAPAPAAAPRPRQAGRPGRDVRRRRGRLAHGRADGARARRAAGRARPLPIDETHPFRPCGRMDRHGATGGPLGVPPAEDRAPDRRLRQGACTSRAPTCRARGISGADPARRGALRRLPAPGRRRAAAGLRAPARRCVRDAPPADGRLLRALRGRRVPAPWWSTSTTTSHRRSATRWRRSRRTTSPPGSPTHGRRTRGRRGPGRGRRLQRRREPGRERRPAGPRPRLVRARAAGARRAGARRRRRPGGEDLAGAHADDLAVAAAAGAGDVLPGRGRRSEPYASPLLAPDLPGCRRRSSSPRSTTCCGPRATRTPRGSAEAGVDVVHRVVAGPRPLLPGRRP